QAGEVGLLYYRDILPLASPADTEAVRYSARADLSITKSASVDPIVAGAGTMLTYTMVVTNDGPDPAVDVLMTDNLPAEMDFVSAVATPQGICLPAGSIVNCELGQIEVGDSVTIEIEVTVPADSTGGLGATVTNTATVSSNATDTNLADNLAMEDTTITTEGELAVVKTSTPPTVVAGTPTVIVYTIEVTNSGPSDSAAVTLTDILPTDVTVSTVIPGLPTCDVGVNPFQQTNQTVSCGLGLIPAAGMVTVTIEVTADPAAVGALTNNVSVASVGTPDPDLGNNASAAVNTALSEADAGITKSADQDPAVPGETLLYTLDISNAGPSDAHNVVVTDTLPTGVSQLSAVPSQGTCGGDPTIVCNLGSVTALGAQIEIEVLIDPSRVQPLVNTASLTTTSVDANAANDSDTQVTDLLVVADLGIVKDDFRTLAFVGQPVTYTITVTNGGPSDAVEATVQDIFPAELLDVISLCIATPGSVCSLRPIAGDINEQVNVLVGGVVTFTATGTVDPSTVSTTLENTATVTELLGSLDPNLADNSSTDIDDIGIFADGFESGDTSFWSIVVPFQQDGAARAHVAFDTAALDFGPKGRLLVFRHRTDWPGGDVARIVAQLLDGEYRLRARVQRDDGAWIKSPWTVLSPGAHSLQIHWWAAPSADIHSGGLRFWIDGEPAADLTGIDNDSHRLAAPSAQGGTP
ncbi:MAG: DUF11 domain-containing protein, partial [Thermoanaerobaculia bacterium]